MKYTLIGGPNHGGIVELSDGVDVYEGIYRKAVANYLVHESLIYSKNNDWYSLDKHYENDVRPKCEYLNSNVSVFTVGGVILSFMCSSIFGLGDCQIITDKTWYNHELAERLDILRD